ncbi:glycosyltransferase [Streptomyces malaysiensis]|uniref:glycosyltransferase n=1 Tax=Streptomyces malaysiensis TaxID=92644 RepID=UPI0033F5EE19
MTTQHHTQRRSILLVRTSWCIDAVTGTDRSISSFATALAAAGHQVAIATATEQHDGTGLPGVPVEQFDLPLALPCTSQVLREALITTEAKVQRSLSALIVRRRVDTVVSVGALWGLGRVPIDLPYGAQRVLVVPALPQEQDIPPALAYADTIITPYDTVLRQATTSVWPTRSWCLVPNAPLHEPGVPVPVARKAEAPVRVLAPAGQDVGVLELIAAARAWHRHVEIALGPPGPDDISRGRALRQQCQMLADRAPNITLEPVPGWAEIPGWLAEAAAVITPCRRPTSNMTALEALSQGTPVIAYNSGILSDLLQPLHDGPRRLLADVMHGPNALLFLADKLLADPATYRAACQAAQSRAQDFRPARIAQLFCAALS